MSAGQVTEGDAAYIAIELRRMVAARRKNLDAAGALQSLRCVRERAQSDGKSIQVALEATLNAACARLDADDTRCARILLGLDPAARRLDATSRYGLIADPAVRGWAVESIRRLRMPEFVDMVAFELLKMEDEAATAGDGSARWHAARGPFDERRAIMWADFDRLIEALADPLRNQDPDAIIAIARGGLPVGVALSHALDARRPFGVITVWKYEPPPGSDLVVTHVDGAALPPGEYGSIALIDDFVTRGDTMTAAIDCIRGRYGPTTAVSCYALFDKPLHQVHDLSVAEHLDPDQWIVLPWEQRGIDLTTA